MREIKYRAMLDKLDYPRSYKKGWVYGFVSKYKDEWYIDTFGNHGNFVANGEYLKIDPKSIGQYTGVKDSKGNEIYDGSILYISDREDYQVVYFDSEGCYGTDEFALFELVRDKNRSFEVVGSSYENPELITS